MKKIKVAHLTSVHPRYDARIFLKMCCSLAIRNFNIYLVVADGRGNEKKNNVNIIDVGSSKTRMQRIFQTTNRIFKQAKTLDADIYHLHDPELLLIGVKLKQLGKKVIFDSHEDVSLQILSKTYLNKKLGWMISKLYSLFEIWACKKIDGVIAATPTIANNFKQKKLKTVDINNYPILDELVSNKNELSDKKNQFCYVGGLTQHRGIQEIIVAIGEVNTKLILAGNFNDEEFKKTCENINSWNQINAVGFVDRNEIKTILNESIAGLCTLHPILNYIDSLPIKMFEYMAAGIPVISSDFKLWREIIEENNCGICVNPKSSESITEALIYLKENPKEAREMGKNGRRLIEKEYNWSKEENKLYYFYNNI
jgi:glycosyltransferase involved in cell wall biosynthesis